MPLLQACIGHENNQIDHIAMHIQEDLERLPVAVASADAQAQARDDDEPPPPSSQGTAQESASCDFCYDAAGL
ncbi:MAG: hypothetical protein LBE81_07310 [Azonexus sp.]|jgi:hypothetical protein|uniref:hypothetical protein n=1 Tax=Azonexus sp. TaxID=1872668 RepID=UPI0028304E9B|nr:hypothetical protein [Azonexus sp.]MDR0776430.1 hypothetical protein [Azonexus sp.]